MSFGKCKLGIRHLLAFLTLPLSILVFVGSGSVTHAQSASALTVLASDTQHVILELNTPEYASADVKFGGKNYTQLTIDGMGHTGEAGKPDLPIQGAMVGVPPGAQVTLKILQDDTRNDDLSAPPVPVGAVRAHSDPTQIMPTFAGESRNPDPAVYSGGAVYPADPASLGAKGNWRSQHFVNVQLHPLQYDSGSQKIIFHKKLQVELVFDYPNGTGAQAVGELQDEGAFDEVLKGSIVNYDSAKNWRSPVPPSKVKGTTGAPVAGNTVVDAANALAAGAAWYKIAVKDDGMYRINCQQLANAGMNISTLNPKTIKIFKNGTELMIYVNGESDGHCDKSDSIQFFAQGINTKYSNTNVYWLTSGGANGKRMAAAASTTGGTKPANFQAMIHRERDLLYRSALPRVEGADHWFWSIIGGTDFIWDDSFQLDHPTAGGATLKYSAIGFNPGQHHTIVKINDQQVADEHWSGQTEHIGNIPFDASVLHAGANTFHVEEPTDSDPNDFAFGNYYEITFPNTYAAGGDQLLFSQATGGQLQFKITGFTTSKLNVFDITDPTKVRRITGITATPKGNKFTLGFGANNSGQRKYWALASPQFKTPLSITKDKKSNLKSNTNHADYLIITNGAFKPNVQGLATLRSGQNLNVMVIDVQDVYDEFSDGVVDAQAIRDFLAYAYANWQVPKPSYVLLVGNGTFDPKYNCLAAQNCPGDLVTPPDSTWIPPYLRLVDPYIGETASDNQFVALNPGNNLPVMAIGRLPANNAGEVDTMVSKITSYETSAGDWGKNISFVSDNAFDSSGNLDSAGNFWLYSEEVAGSPSFMPSPYVADRIYYNPCGSCSPPFTTIPNLTTTQGDIVSAINDGRLIVNYVGHSFITFWADEPLFSTDNVAGLDNDGKLPVFLDMTCYTGFFQYPGLPSLGSALVKKSGGGAIASWSASGLGVTSGHDLLDKGFFNSVMQTGERHIGNAAVAGKNNLFTSGINLDLIDTFNLLGDPATKLAVPQ